MLLNLPVVDDVEWVWLQGGRHVDYVADQCVTKLMEIIKKKNKDGIKLKPFQVSLWSVCADLFCCYVVLSSEVYMLCIITSLKQIQSFSSRYLYGQGLE